MLLRDDEQIALNDIHALCIEIAGHYESAASKACLENIRNDLLKAGRLHHAFAARTAIHIRRRDDQPRLPDPDTESVENLITSIKLKLTGDEKRLLIEDQFRLEQQLLDRLNAGMSMNFSEEIKLLFQEAAAHVRALQQILATAAK